MKYSLDLDNQPAEDVGLQILRARQEQRLTLKDVAQQLHVRLAYLEAIESGRLDYLPGKVYTIGFIKAYAKLLKLDGDSFIRSLNLKQEDPDNIEPSHKAPAGSSKKLIVFSLILTIFSAISLHTYCYFFVNNSNIEPTSELKIIEETPKLESPQELYSQENMLTERSPVLPNSAKSNEYPSLPSSSEATSTREETVAELGIVLKASADSWLVVYSDGLVTFRGILSKDESRELKPHDYITLGNAGGVQVVCNGRSSGILGRSGEVRKNLKVSDLCISSLKG